MSSAACDRSSWTSADMLMWLGALGGCSTARWEGGIGVDVLQGAATPGKWSPSVNWGRYTGRKEGSWAGSPSVFMPWTSAPDREVSTGSRHLFNPLGYTTWSPHCRSQCTNSWWRCLHVLLLGVPLIMALRCPSLGRGTCLASSLSCTKM